MQKKGQDLQEDMTENLLVSSASLTNKNRHNFKEPNLKNSNELIKSTKKSKKLKKLVNSENNLVKKSPKTLKKPLTQKLPRNSENATGNNSENFHCSVEESEKLITVKSPCRENSESVRRELQENCSGIDSNTNKNKVKNLNIVSPNRKEE